jgi:hydroxyacylglutathione hydrolase
MVERVVVGPWKTNCYIYSSSKKECIIIDPGGDEQEIASRVDVLNMVPVGIALTHGHVDHVGALGRLRQGYANRGYKLSIAISSADRKFLGTEGMETHRESLEYLGLDEITFFGVDPSELPKADVRLKEGERVFGMDLVALETPGHTPGSVCFYSEKEGVLFSGDTLFFDGVGRTDLPGGSEKKLRESILKKIAVLPPETRVFPGHGPFTTVEREKRGNAFFRETPSETRLPPSLPPRAKPAVVLAKARPAAKAKAARGKPAAAIAKPAAHGKPTVGVKHPVRVKHAAGIKHAVAAKRASSTVKKGPKQGRLQVKSAPARKGGSRTLRAPVKRAQATRSTKAPGSGKKPPR